MDKVVVFGASGTAGRAIVAEAVRQGYAALAVSRNPGRLGELPAGAIGAAGDVTRPESIRELAPGALAVIVAVNGPGRDLWKTAARALVETLSTFPPPRPRILHMGGGGSLIAPDGRTYSDTPQFPRAFLDAALGQAEALGVYRQSQGIVWTYLSPPPFELVEGPRTGFYRVGTDRAVANAAGRSKISYADFAVALIDELRRGRFPKARFTVGY